MSVTLMVFLLVLAVIVALSIAGYVGVRNEQVDKQRAHELELAKLQHDEAMARARGAAIRPTE